MTHRNLILCMALAVVASGALATRHELHKRAWRREGGGKGFQGFRLGFFRKPRLDTSLTSNTVPL